MSHKNCNFCFNVIENVDVDQTENPVKAFEGNKNIVWEMFSIVINSSCNEDKVFVYFCSQCDKKLKDCYDFYQTIQKTQVLIGEQNLQMLTKIEKDNDEPLIINECVKIEKIEDESCEVDQNNAGLDEELEFNDQTHESSESQAEYPQQTSEVTVIEHDKAKKCLEDEDRRIQEFYSLVCSICKVPFQSFTLYKSHSIREHGFEQPIVCCERKLSKRHTVLEHLKYHTDPDQFKCNVCQKQLYSAGSIRLHMLRDHPKVLPFQCGHCLKRFSTISYAKNHAKMHLPQEVKDSLKVHKCKICFKTFVQKSRMNKHYRCVHLKLYKTYECKTCGKNFKNKTNFEIHQRKHMSQEERDQHNVTCEHCGKEFSEKYYLDAHIKRTNLKVNAIICHVCAKEFLSKVAFLYHYKHTHIKLSRVQCDICETWLAGTKALKLHKKRQHSGLGPCKCDECEKVCPNIHALKSHQRHCHNPRPEYKCIVCDKKYRKKLSLTEHMANVHDGQPLSRCCFCERTFQCSASMYRHRKKMHPEETKGLNNKKRGNKINF